METTSKQMQFTFKAPGGLVSHLNGIKYIIIEHQVSEFETCGYDIAAFRDDGGEVLRREFVGSSQDMLEALDFFIFECEECCTDSVYIN
jgi:hypothetical protein